MENELIYLASPYTTDDSVEREIRFVHTCDAAAHLMNKGELVVFSPIAHGVPIARMKDLPTTWEYWENNCRTFLSRCQGVVVLMLPGWDKSIGVTNEIEIANELDIPIVYMDPNTYNSYLNPLEGF